MFKLHILSHLSKNTKVRYYFSSRKLLNDEIALVKADGLKRYCLPRLSSSQEQRFFQEFDVFWEQVIYSRDWNDSFWRNGISSKMQEWENSCGYLAIALFTLSVSSPIEEIELIVLPENVEEAEVWRAWALTHGWIVASYDFGCFQRVIQQINNFFRVVRLFALCIIKKLFSSTYLPVIRPGAILAVTLFYYKSLTTEKYEDLFFNNLCEETAFLGRDILYVGDIIDRISYADSMRMGKSGRPVSIYSLVSWLDIFAGFLIVFNRAPCIKKSVFLGVDFSAILSWHARRARYDFNLTAEFFYRAIRRACRRYNFAKMLYAFEGNVYERAVIQGFREETSAPIDAYSHAVLYPLNLKLHISPSEAELIPEPDRYLVCSAYFRDLLYRLRKVKTKMIPVCSLRPIFHPRGIKKNSGTNVLIVLDGFWSTAVVLDWLYQNSGVFKSRQVIIRPHPNVGWNRLIKQCPNYQAGVFHVSRRILKEDFEDAFCVIYRQSSVGIQALTQGIPVIYLGIEQPLFGDPLENGVLGKMIATDALELSNALSRVPMISKELLSIGDDMRGFAAQYFSPPKLELFRFFVEANQ